MKALSKTYLFLILLVVFFVSALVNYLLWVHFELSMGSKNAVTNGAGPDCKRGRCKDAERVQTVYIRPSFLPIPEIQKLIRALRTNTRVRYLIEPLKVGRRRMIGERQYIGSRFHHTDPVKSRVGTTSTEIEEEPI